MCTIAFPCYCNWDHLPGILTSDYLWHKRRVWIFMYFSCFWPSYGSKFLLGLLILSIDSFGWCSLSELTSFCFYLRGEAKRTLWYMSNSVLPMFSSKNFTVFGLTFKSLIHFIFVYGVRKYSSSILLHIAVQFSQHHVLKRLSFLHCIFWPLFSKIRCP